MSGFGMFSGGTSLTPQEVGTIVSSVLRDVIENRRGGKFPSKQDVELAVDWHLSQGDINIGEVDARAFDKKVAELVLLSAKIIVKE